MHWKITAEGNVQSGVHLTNHSVLKLVVVCQNKGLFSWLCFKVPTKRNKAYSSYNCMHAMLTVIDSCVLFRVVGTLTTMAVLILKDRSLQSLTNALYLYRSPDPVCSVMFSLF